MGEKIYTTGFVSEIKTLIEQSKRNVALAINSEITALYWHVGNRINSEILQNERAEYGKQIVQSLSAQLEQEYGKGWGEKQLRQCMQFALVYPDKEIVYALRRQLKERIQSMLYERTAISKKPELTIQNDLELLQNEQKLSADLVFRDPYVLDFLGLSDAYSEKDLETSIIAELQRFIIELGSDFAFMARQKRITIDNREYYIDLLFYHRRLKCLIAIDLKIGEFEAAHKGQMELYLRYLEKHEQVEGENTPIGLILCTGKNEEHVELMQLHKSNIHVADYLTLLPSQKVLKQKLHQAIEIAKNRIDIEKG